MTEPCSFCHIAAGRADASIVAHDALTVAFVDARQFHHGHVLVIPRQHVADIRAADDATVAAVAVTVSRVARAVDAVFPSDGLSIWHSAGAGANQEVPHFHVHVHPRRLGDDLLQIYPRSPATPTRATLDEIAAAIRDGIE